MTQAGMMAAGPPDSRRRSEQTPNHALRKAYRPRFAAPVRPKVRTATGLMQPGWPVHPPTPSPVEPTE